MTDLWYNFDATLEDLYLFFGREHEIEWVNQQLARGHLQVAIYGSRHIGKTSLLHTLIDRLPGQYLAVYLDADKAVGWETGSPLLQVAGEVGRKVREQAVVGIQPPEPASFGTDPLAAWRGYLDHLEQQLKPRHLVLLIDNADAAGAEWLHILLQSQAPVVLTAESHAEFSELLPGRTFAAPAITLGPLSTEAAEDLVKAVITDKAPIDPWAVRRVVEMTSHHPYYVHLFCRVLLECCTHRTPITPPQVESALQAILEMPLADFIIEWKSSLPRERLVLSIFGGLLGHGGIATQYDIQKAYSRHGRPPPLADVVATLDNLDRRVVLEKMGANSYRFQLELFRLWIHHHHPPEETFRSETWRFRRPWFGGFEKAAEAFARRRTLWLSLGIVGLVALVVAFQPVLWGRRPRSAPTPRAAARTIQVTPTPTSAMSSPTSTSPPPASPLALAGYDLLMMSREGRDAPWQLYALNTDTGNRLRLSDTDWNERTPKWSSDGNRIAFVSERDGNREIYVMDLNDWMAGEGEPVNLTAHKAPDWQPSWAPVDDRIAFSSYRDDNWEIYTIGADGTGLTRVTDHPESDISPVWSPDGGALLFVSRRQGDADLFVKDLSTGEYKQLTTGQLDEFDPSWSPDGEWVAFVTQIGTQGDVFVMRVDGTQAVNLTNSAYANDFQPVWTADSEWVIFVSYTAAEGEHDLFKMRRDGSELSPVTDDDHDNLAPSLRYLD
jgi:TolB protein